MVRPWKLVSSKVLFDDEWFCLRADRCLRSDGVQIEPYYVQEAQDCVCVLALTVDDRIVITNEYRHGIGQVVKGLPGGVIDHTDIDSVGAAERELREETGFCGKHSTYLGYTYANAARQTNKVYHYLIIGSEKVSHQYLDRTEEISVSLYPIDVVLAPGFLKQTSNLACLLLAQSHLLRNR